MILRYCGLHLTSRSTVLRVHDMYKISYEFLECNGHIWVAHLRQYQRDISSLNTLPVKIVVSQMGHLEVDATFDRMHL